MDDLISLSLMADAIADKKAARFVDVCLSFSLCDRSSNC